MTTTTETPAEDLRTWAKGMYPIEAATELLIRTGYAQIWRPWTVQEQTGQGEVGSHWLDFSSIPDHIGGMSGGEARLLRIAAAIGSDDVEISLSECINGLDRKHVDLVLAALAHAAGTHEGRPMIVDHEAGIASFGDPYASLHPWPSTDDGE